jgi:uncharacterized protein
LHPRRYISRDRSAERSVADGPASVEITWTAILQGSRTGTGKIRLPADARTRRKFGGWSRPGRARRDGRRLARTGGIAALFVALAVALVLLATHRHGQRAPAAVAAAPAMVGLRQSRVIPPPKPVDSAAPRPPVAVPSPAARPAWLRFAVPVPPIGDRPRIAIVIDDLGLDRRRTAAVIGLPGPLTLSFMTYARDLPEQTEAARRAGHELLLHVPMQPLDRREDPGPNALTVAMSADEIKRALDWGLDRFGGFIGINNHMGSRFTADPRGMAVVMAELRRRGLAFLDSKTTAASVGIREAVADGVPHAVRDVFLDDDLQRTAIARQLALVERVARRTGSAVAIGHGHDPTIAALRVWLSGLPAKGLALVPLTAVVEFRMRRATQTGRGEVATGDALRVSRPPERSQP